VKGGKILVNKLDRSKDVLNKMMTFQAEGYTVKTPLNRSYNIGDLVILYQQMHSFLMWSHALFLNNDNNNKKKKNRPLFTGN